MRSLSFELNGRSVAVDVQEDAPLLSVLRDTLRLTGARFGCGLEQCSACVVLLDGEPIHSCARAAASVAGRSVTTVEALTAEGHPLLEAFISEQAGQCGYCLSGILMSAKALLDRTVSPTREEVAAALDRHLCRCGAHYRILRAVDRAAAILRERATAAS